tara:strand:- start:3240 stop:3467 length:228 start_codon:yes stop_codon:yes gene_type:complete
MYIFNFDILSDFSLSKMQDIRAAMKQIFHVMQVVEGEKEKALVPISSFVVALFTFSKLQRRKRDQYTIYFIAKRK